MTGSISARLPDSGAVDGVPARRLSACVFGDIVNP